MRAGQSPGQSELLTAACAAITRAAVAVLRTLDEQVTVLQGQVDAHFGQHSDAEIVLYRPGLRPILGAQMLAEFEDDPRPYTDAKSGKLRGTSPSLAPPARKVVARFVQNDRLLDTLMARSTVHSTPHSAARAYYNQIKSTRHRTPHRVAPAR